MRIVIYIMMLAAILTAFYQMKSPDPNVIVTSVCVAVFMFGMMRLSAKTPSKNNDHDNQ